MEQPLDNEFKKVVEAFCNLCYEHQLQMLCKLYHMTEEDAQALLRDLYK